MSGPVRDAVAGVPRLVPGRRLVPPAVERLHRALEEDPLRGEARRYTS